MAAPELSLRINISPLLCVSLSRLPDISVHFYASVRAANRLHGSIDALVGAVDRYFASRTPAETLKLAA